MGHQALLKITRTSEAEYKEENFGAVRFVPLVGEQGWVEDGLRSATTHVPGKASGKTLPEMIAEAAEALPDIDDPAFGRLFDRFADRRVVLLGEASHGTSEFYRARAAITRHLVEYHGFTIVAVEADWPDAEAVDRYVRHRGPPHVKAEPPFQRFPTWMWRNTDVDEFLDWLFQHNQKITQLDDRAGFYGLDIYNMSGSIAAVLDYLDEVDPEAAAIARERYGCLTPWQKEPSTYGRAVLTSGYKKCEKAVIQQCRELLEKRSNMPSRMDTVAILSSQPSRQGARQRHRSSDRDQPPGDFNHGQCLPVWGLGSSLIVARVTSGTVMTAVIWVGGVRLSSRATNNLP